MKNRFFVVIILLFTQRGSAQVISETPFSIGETIEMYSNTLSENRTLNIYLPESYQSDKAKRYPVIYLLDGSKDEDFIHVAGLVQFCSFSWIDIIDESIVVGIGNVDRKRDFTYPSNLEIDKKEFPTSGGSDRFMNFIEKEVQTIIANKYRVIDQKTIIGQSLGGLLATEILFKRPDLFDNYIIVSPSLWWDDEALLNYEPDKIFKDKSVYIGVGKEGPVMERVAKSLFDKLIVEMPDDAKIHFGFFETQSHGDALHLAVYDAFEKIFNQD